MNATNLRFATYNIGTPGGETCREEEIKAANKIADLADVICLQQVQQRERPFMKTLAERGFSLIHTDENTAIACRLNTTFFYGDFLIAMSGKLKK